MATGYFTCGECGGQIRVRHAGNRRDTDRYCEWLEQQGRVCSDCEEKQRQAANTAAAEKNAAAGLSSLTGSEKQIAWAETIRDQKLETIRQSRSGELQGWMFDAYWGSGLYGESLPVEDLAVDHAVSLLTAKTSASWWIDNRETKVGIILKSLLVSSPPPAAIPQEIAPAKEEAEREATIRPETPLTETVAEIRVKDQAVEIHFPEKRDDFWRIVKKQLGYSWLGGVWRKRIGVTTGTALDRAAEAGNRLLRAGFVVRCFNDEARVMMLAASFAPECHRWVMAKVRGEYAGWFAISWAHGDDLYSEARRLPGSRYSKPEVVVPAEHFAEILDFAEVNGFQLSPGANALVAKARASRDAALVARPAAPPTIAAPASCRPDLDPSTAGAIDADLLDD